MQHLQRVLVEQQASWSLLLPWLTHWILRLEGLVEVGEEAGAVAPLRLHLRQHLVLAAEAEAQSVVRQWYQQRLEPKHQVR